MVDETELSRRRALTFEQAEGIAELPRQLLRDEMPSTLRARLLLAITDSIEAEMKAIGNQYGLGPKWQRSLKAFYAGYAGLVSASFERTASPHLSAFEAIFNTSPAHVVFGNLQALLRHAQMPSFSESVAVVLEQERSAYRLVDGDTLIPVGSEEEAETVMQPQIYPKATMRSRYGKASMPWNLPFER